jgi:O-antigen ligase
LLALFLTAVLVGLIWFRRPLIVLLVAAAPIVFIAIVVNHRRAGLAALFLEIVSVMALAAIAEPRFRRNLLVAGVLMAVVGAAFVVAFWNQPNGSIAELIRPIKSLIDPSARDLSSDQYRLAETLNLKATFRTSPVFGIGFGHPYYVFYPQTGVASIDPLWNIIPHNTVLWIPMRMGIIGLISFWALISMVIIQTFWIIRKVRDRFVLAVTVFALAAIVGELFTGYYDIGLENYRNLAVLGLLIAVINRAPHLARREETVSDQIVEATS